MRYICENNKSGIFAKLYFRKGKKVNFFDANYKSLFYERGAPYYATRKIHKLLEEGVLSNSGDLILEVGAGEGFHVPYVDSNFSKYFMVDISSRDLEPLAAELQSQGKLEFSVGDGRSLPYEDDKFDRVIFMCTLHHIQGTMNVLNQARRVTKSGGLISIYLPCDPGLIYRLFRWLILLNRVRKLRLDYGLINAIEHSNHFDSILKQTKKAFAYDQLDMKYWPLPPFHSWNINICAIIQIRVVK